MDNVDMEDVDHSHPRVGSDRLQKRAKDRQSYSRTIACDACRISKTRCNSARPACASCARRGRPCVYPETDPSSRLEEWGQRILAAIEAQGRQLSNLTEVSGVEKTSQLDYADDGGLEAASRQDVPYTPITAGDVILTWSVFPETKPLQTFPPAAHTPKPIEGNPEIDERLFPSPERISALRQIFMHAVEDKAPIIDPDQLDAYIAEAQTKGSDYSASSCLVFMVFAIGAIFGKYPEDERRLVASHKPGVYTIAIPEERWSESCMYLSMAQKCLAAAISDTSLLGPVCFTMLGTWHLYNINPIEAWKMFRTASMLWEAYNVKCSHSQVTRTEKEQSLSERVYWAILKIECEIRQELPDLPIGTLHNSAVSFTLPSFPVEERSKQSPSTLSSQDAVDGASPSSHYFFLTEVYLKRLHNRTRHVVTGLSKTIDSIAATRITNHLRQLRGQLQQWLDCLPAPLRFNIPPDSMPPSGESEMIKLVRERFVEVSELLCRAYLYICIHGGSRLTLDQIQEYGAIASAGLCLNVYRIRTEKPFWRHAGSWMASRIRFSHALCLIAAARAKEMGIVSASCVELPSEWSLCVSLVQERLDIWSDQGGGIKEMSELLRWLMSKEL